MTFHGTCNDELASWNRTNISLRRVQEHLSGVFPVSAFRCGCQNRVPSPSPRPNERFRQSQLGCSGTDRQLVLTERGFFFFYDLKPPFGLRVC